MKFGSDIKKILKDTGSTYFFLLKIMIPISIIVKILSELGIIKIIGQYLTPVMDVIGLPGEFSLVWATGMITNIYGALIVFFQLSIQNSYTVSQVTVLACLLLVAHTLPIEARIAQKAGVRLWWTLFLRIFCAFILAGLINVIFSYFKLYQYENKLIWEPEYTNPTAFQMITGEIRYYIIIFLIILIMMTIMHILKKTGVIEKLNNFLEPGLEQLGMSKNAAPITIIGMTLGLAYGGGIIVKEAKEKNITKKDTFLSLSLMGLSHSLFEDTLLMFAIGATLVGILFGRLIFTIIIMIILIQIINKLTIKKFERFFTNK